MVYLSFLFLSELRGLDLPRPSILQPDSEGGESFPLDDITIKTYPYSQLFSIDDLKAIKKNVWEDMQFRREDGKEMRAQQDKQRYYTLESDSVVGFGYNNTWIDNAPLSQSTRLIMDSLKKQFPDQCLSLNSALVTAYYDCSDSQVDMDVSSLDLYLNNSKSIYH